LTEDVKSALPSGPCRGGRRYIYTYSLNIYKNIIFAYVYKHTYQDKSQHE
jgi:hypothetical protein